MNNIYISPHSDDICYSLGDCISRNPGGYLINIYTRSNYINPTVSSILENQLSIEEISTIRRKEDQLFANKVGLNLVDLSMNDASVVSNYLERHLLTNTHQDVDELEPQLLSAIMNRVSNSAARLFCPAAIGMHRNHVATMMCIVKNIEVLKRHFKICFYEEIPYSRGPDIRDQGQAKLQMLTNDRQFFRVKHHKQDNVSVKEQLIKIYQSQLKQPFDINRYFQGWETNEQYESWLELR